MAASTSVTFPRTKYIPGAGDITLRTSNMDSVKKTVWIFKRNVDHLRSVDSIINFFRMYGIECEYSDTLVPCLEVTGSIYQYSTALSLSFKYVLSEKKSAFDGRKYTRERDVSTCELSVPSVIFSSIEYVLGFVDDETFSYTFNNTIPIPDDDFAVLEPSAPFTDIPFATQVLSSLNGSLHTQRIGKDCELLRDHHDYARMYFLANSEVGLYEALKRAHQDSLTVYTTYPVILDKGLVERLSETTPFAFTFHSSVRTTGLQKAATVTMMEPGINRKMNMYVDFSSAPKQKRPPPRSSVPSSSVYLPNRNHPKSLHKDIPITLEIIEDIDDTVVSFSHNLGVIPLRYTWDFGDGYESTASRPAHHYQSSGDYNVCLRAWVIVNNVLEVYRAEKTLHV